MSFNMAGESVDAIVTDPPYELGFMGKGWDRTGIANDVGMWRAAFDVLKPGGHLLAFSGTRTYHRMACAIEDAGFEIRDQMAWVFGSGFPKSLDVSKAIDKAAGVQRPVTEGRHDRRGDGTVYGIGHSGAITCNTPITAAAAQWQGWGTALKPAWEPIVVARKPLIGTVAENVLTHGTGTLNIDGCRVGANGGCRTEGGDVRIESQPGAIGAYASSPLVSGLGRWPANLIHDGSDEVLAAFPQAPGQQARAKDDGTASANAVYGALRNITTNPEPRAELDKSAARFFYCAKASKSDRGDGNTHPTVKPTELMRYLCRLVTPPGGTVLDPFMGSGSTGKAAMLEGFRFIGVEMSPEYMQIARQRLALEGDDLW